MRLRESVRAHILDEQDSTLLVRFDWAGLEVPGGIWANPGGGVAAEKSRATFSPRRLPVLLEDLLSGAVPDEPILPTGF